MISPPKVVRLCLTLRLEPSYKKVLRTPRILNAFFAGILPLSLQIRSNELCVMSDDTGQFVPRDTRAEEERPQMGRRLVYPLECTADGIVPVFVLVFVDSVAVQATVLRRGFVMGDALRNIHDAPDIILALMREHHDGERLTGLP